MNVSREIGAFVNNTFRVKIVIKSPQTYNREQFQIGQGGYSMKDVSKRTKMHWNEFGLIKSELFKSYIHWKQLQSLGIFAIFHLFVTQE